MQILVDLPSLSRQNELATLVRRTETFRDQGRIRTVTLRLVEALAGSIVQGLTNLREAIDSPVPPTPDILDGERARLIDDVADLGALVASFEEAYDDKACSLVADLVRQFTPRFNELDIHIARQTRPNVEIRSYNLQVGSNRSVAIWIPDDRFLREPLLGILAHEAAHCCPEVARRRESLSPLLRRRGEAIADLFATGGLGPGFAWGASEYLVNARPSRVSRLTRTPNHPPWSVRLAVVRRLVSGIWDGDDLRRWIMIRLQPAVDAAGYVQNALSGDIEDYVLDAEGLIEELRRVKLAERDMRRVRGLRLSRPQLRPILEFVALVPG